MQQHTGLVVGRVDGAPSAHPDACVFVFEFAFGWLIGRKSGTVAFGVRDLGARLMSVSHLALGLAARTPGAAWLRADGVQLIARPIARLIGTRVARDVLMVIMCARVGGSRTDGSRAARKRQWRRWISKTIIHFRLNKLALAPAARLTQRLGGRPCRCQSAWPAANRVLPLLIDR